MLYVSRRRLGLFSSLSVLALSHIEEFGAAVNLAIALRDPSASVAGKTIAAFQALGDVGVSGATCRASSLSGTIEAQASINVPVSASVQGSAG
jgi:hypothetical protein